MLNCCCCFSIMWQYHRASLNNIFEIFLKIFVLEFFFIMFFELLTACFIVMLNKNPAKTFQNIYSTFC